MLVAVLGSVTAATCLSSKYLVTPNVLQACIKESFLKQH